MMSHMIFTNSVTNCHTFLDTSIPWGMTYFMDCPLCKLHNYEFGRFESHSLTPTKVSNIPRAICKF